MSHEPTETPQSQPQPKKSKPQPAPTPQDELQPAPKAEFHTVHADRLYVGEAIVLTPETAPRKPGLWPWMKRAGKWCAGRGANGYLKVLALVNGTYTLRSNLRGGSNATVPKAGGSDLD